MQLDIETLLDLESGEPVPRVNESTLRQAHNRLLEHLEPPVSAVYSEPENDDSDAEFQVEISHLLSVDEHPVFGPYLGILCEAEVNENQETIVVPLSRITDVKDEGNRKFIETYNEWFWNFR